MTGSAGRKILHFDEIAGFTDDDLAAALATFRRSAELLVAAAPSQRPARAPFPGLIAAARAALAHDEDAESFFRRWFEPALLPSPGFLTGYYEVEVEARRTPDAEFATPILPRPPDLVTLNDAPLSGPDGVSLTSARLRPDGALEPYPERRAIEEGEFSGGAPLAYLRDRVELFLIQVQGSARLRFEDGTSAALTYDGRNGHPYTSIGRLMVARGLLDKETMSLAALKAKVREMGLGPGEPGRRLLQENQSYVFFQIDPSPERALGPIGGAGCALTPLRSIAVDRGLWSYGLPFFISAHIPWRSAAPEPFARLMIAQDTGSAILGEARADLYFGCGDAAGALAGGIRHDANLIVMLPRA